METTPPVGPRLCMAEWSTVRRGYIIHVMRRCANPLPRKALRQSRAWVGFTPVASLHRVGEWPASGLGWALCSAEHREGVGESGIRPPPPLLAALSALF